VVVATGVGLRTLQLDGLHFKDLPPRDFETHVEIHCFRSAEVRAVHDLAKSLSHQRGLITCGKVAQGETCNVSCEAQFLFRTQRVLTASYGGSSS
jgi:hypothetical protein